MRLFNYLRSGIRSSGRFAGQWGIDISLAVQEYSRQNFADGQMIEGSHLSLTDWFADGPAAMDLIQAASDWILAQLPGSEAAFCEQGFLFELAKVELLSPAAPTGKLICVAGNYPAPGRMERPPFPTVFIKPTGGITLDGSKVRLPAIAENVACEVELAVLIGRSGRRLAPENALECVAGYTIANDLGDRVLEKRTSQWTSGKMFDTFTPVSPFVVTADEVEHPGAMGLTTSVNGEWVQIGNTAEMFFDVPSLLVYLSELTTLQPGDLILTGSPKMMRGEPQPLVSLKPGDQVEVAISGLGSVVNFVVPEGKTS